jgi:hypothetical protein
MPVNVKTFVDDFATPGLGDLRRVSERHCSRPMRLYVMVLPQTRK